MQELSHVVVAATGELVSCHPLEGILDVLVIDEDEFLSLAKAFCDKGGQPTGGKKKNTTKGDSPDDGTKFQFVLVLDGGQDTVHWRSRKGFTKALGKE